jgi:hypothetical protein
LARAIISIAIHDFRVEENSSSWEHISYGGMYYVHVVDVPTWEPYENHVVSIGGTTVVLNQDLQTALKTARDDVKEIRETIGSRDQMEQRTYLLLSVRHVMLCHTDSTGTFLYTPPIAFMDGSSPPSLDATRVLLQALSPAFRPPPCTPVHALPLEIQDRILVHVSEGPVEAARLGCLLGLGSPFLW